MSGFSFLYSQAVKLPCKIRRSCLKVRYRKLLTQLYTFAVLLFKRKWLGEGNEGNEKLCGYSEMKLWPEFSQSERLLLCTLGPVVSITILHSALQHMLTHVFSQSWFKAVNWDITCAHQPVTSIQDKDILLTSHSVFLSNYLSRISSLFSACSNWKLFAY